MEIRHSTISTTSSTRQRRLDLEEELACLNTKMSMAKVKEDLDKANRETVTESLRNTGSQIKELAEKNARINVFKRFEEEVAMPDFEDDDQNNVEDHIMKFLNSQPNLTRQCPDQ